MSKFINRREFLQKGTGAALGAGLALSPPFTIGRMRPEKSKIIDIMHPDAVAPGRKIDKDVVRSMLRRGMEEFTGTQNPWGKFVDKNDRVGLKVNMLGRPVLYTHHELVNAVTEELIDYGIKENNIIIWDYPERHLVRAGFTINTSDQGVRCYGTLTVGEEVDRLDPEIIYDSTLDDPENREEGRTYSRMSSIFSRDCDKIINMPILKDHQITGLTLCLKNLAYGIMENVARFHGDRFVDTYIADINALPIVRKKVVLHVVDALEASFRNGPVPKNENDLFAPKRLWFGTDAVAIDTIGYNVVENKRREMGLPSIESIAGSVKHRQFAAAKGIGTDKLDQIKLVKIKL